MIISGNFLRKRVFNTLLLVCITSIIFHGGCEKEEPSPRVHPKIRTLEVAEISTDGARFSGRIEKQGSEEIIEWGFVWSNNNGKLDLDNADYYLEKYTPGSEVLMNDIRSTLVEKETYYIKFFARTASRLVYGNIVTFESMGSRGPEIHDFDPKSGSIGQEITIHGSGFSNRVEGNTVKLDTVKTVILAVSDSLLKVLVPANLSTKSSKISVEVAGKTMVSTSNFELNGPEITSFFPKSGTTGDTVIIEGRNLSANGVETVVKFNGFIANNIINSDEKLCVVVPEISNSDKCQIRVETGKVFTISPEFFNLTIPIIISTLPTIAKHQNKIIVNGSNFSVIPGANKVIIDQLECHVISASKTQLEIMIPLPGSGLIPFPTTPQKASELKVLVSTIASDINESFTILSPRISNLLPTEGTFGDTLILNGTNFSYFSDEFKVFADNSQLVILRLTDEEIVFKHPVENESANIEIKVLTDIFEGDFLFSLLPPDVTTVSPSTITFGDLVDIKCKNLHPDPSKNQVWLNDEQVNIYSFEAGMLRIKIPNHINIPKIQIRIQAGSDETLTSNINNMLFLRKPEIYSVTPTFTENLHEQFVITGSGFNPGLSNNSVSFYWMLDVLEASSTRLVCKLPVFDFPGQVDFEEYLNINEKVTLRCGGYEIQSPQTINLLQDKPWTKLEYVWEPKWPSSSLSVNGIGYTIGSNYVSNEKDRLWSYNPASNVWTEKSKFPGGLRQGMVFVELEGYIYAGLGLDIMTSKGNNDFWRYNPASNSWTRMADFPGHVRWNSFSFSAGDMVYVGAGQYSDFGFSWKQFDDLWEFNPGHNTWIQKNDIPLIGNYEVPFNIGNAMNGIPVMMFLGYTGSASERERHRYFFRYNISSDTWETLYSDVVPLGYIHMEYCSHTVIGNKWYFNTNDENYEPLFFSFDLETNSVRSDIKKPKELARGGAAFTIGDKGYFGMNSTSGFTIYLWKFDPLKVK